MRALLRASRSRRGELVKSCNRLESTSKLMTNASSLERRISPRKLAPTSFSISRTRCWLPLESMRIPRVKGRFGFGGEIFDGLRFSVFQYLEIVFDQVGDQPAFLVLDVEKELDHVHIDLQRAHRLVAVFTRLAGSGLPGPEARPVEEAPGRKRKPEKGWPTAL